MKWMRVRALGLVLILIAYWAFIYVQDMYGDGSGVRWVD